MPTPRGLAIETLEARTLYSTVGYWRFENGVAGNAASGATIIDSSGSGITATAVSGPVYSADVGDSTLPRTLVPNKLSLVFNAPHRRVEIPDAPILQLTKSLTLEAYVKAASGAKSKFGQGKIIFRGDDRGDLDPYLITLIGTDLAFTVADASGAEATVSTPFAGRLNQWTHVAGTLDDATGKMCLYVNGALMASATTAIRAAGPLTGANPGLGIGNTQSAGYDEWFPGSIDEARISDVALSPDDFLRTPAVVPPGSISGVVYSDDNRNGVLDATDVRLGGRAVFLDTDNDGKFDTGETKAVTDSTGTYTFTGLPAGTYRPRREFPSGIVASGTLPTITLTSGQTATGANIGARPAGSTPTPTPTPTAMKYEAEAATLTGGTYKTSNNTGYTGTGYADFGGNGSAAQFAITVASAGSKTLTIRYANGGTTARPLSLVINGASVGTFACNPTGAWSTWQTVSLSASLISGGNTIKLVAGAATGGNVDWLSTV